MPTQLIYIHGFNSSSLSHKAQLMRQFWQKHQPDAQLSTPDLAPSPDEAIEQLRALTDQHSHQKTVFVGSSLGGFYATWLAEQLNTKAALINPAVQPWKLLDKYTGIQHNYHTGKAWELNPAWVNELHNFAIEKPAYPHNLLLLTQTGDETLNWQDGWNLYQDCHLYRGLGGSHGFEDFDAFIPLILRFLDISV